MSAYPSKCLRCISGQWVTRQRNKYLIFAVPLWQSHRNSGFRITSPGLVFLWCMWYLRVLSRVLPEMNSTVKQPLMYSFFFFAKTYQETLWHLYSLFMPQKSQSDSQRSQSSAIQDGIRQITRQLTAWCITNTYTATFKYNTELLLGELRGCYSQWCVAKWYTMPTSIIFHWILSSPLEVQHFFLLWTFVSITSLPNSWRWTSCKEAKNLQRVATWGYSRSSRGWG